MDKTQQHWGQLYKKAEFLLENQHKNKQLNLDIFAAELMNQYRLGLEEGVCSQYRTIKDSPVVGNIPREKIRRPVSEVSGKYATAIKDLGDR